MKITQWKTVIALVTVALLLASCVQQPVESQSPELRPTESLHTTAPTAEPTAQPTEPDTYPEGWYTVGKQLPAGEYVFFPNKAAQKASVRIQRGADTVIKCDFDGQFFWIVQDGDTISVQNGCFMGAAGYVAEARADGSYGPGLYRVGIDIPEGCYLVTPDSADTPAYIKLYQTISENQVTDMDWDIPKDTVIDARGQGAVFLLDGSMVLSAEIPDTTPPTSEAATEATTPGADPSTPLTGNFTEEDAAFFTDFFMQKSGNNGPGPVNYYNRIMSVYDFTSPEQVDIRYVFYDQDIDESWDLTPEEKEFLKGQEKIDLGLSVVRVSAGKVARILQECFGCAPEELKDSGSWVYFPATDCYYSSKGDTHITVFQITGGTWLEEGRVEIYYRIGNDMDMTITLQKNKSGYRVLSNVLNG